MQTAYYTGRASGIHSAYIGSKTAYSTLVRYHMLYNAFKKMTLVFLKAKSLRCSSAQRKTSFHWQIGKRNALHHVDL